MKCPDCRIKFSGDECPECGWRLSRSSDNSIPPPPKICGVKGCGADVSQPNTCVNSVTFRDERGHLFTPANSFKYIHYSGGRGYCNPGYEFVQHVTRCNACFHREQGPDWRDEMIAAEMLKHPEYRAANYSDPVDRADILDMVRTLSQRMTRNKPLSREATSDADESILTGHVVTPEITQQVDTSKYRKM